MLLQIKNTMPEMPTKNLYINGEAEETPNMQQKLHMIFKNKTYQAWPPKIRSDPQIKKAEQV